MKNTSIRVNAQYRITIPKWARKQIKMNPGDSLLVDVQDGIILLLPLPGEYTEALLGLHREIWIHSDSYLLQERAAWM